MTTITVPLPAYRPISDRVVWSLGYRVERGLGPALLLLRKGR